MPRKKANIHYIYKTTCKVTSKYYIGMHSTSNLNDGYLGSGKRLRHSIRKYGKENHVREILEFCESRELLIEAEKKIITLELMNDDKCMNLKEGGCGGFISKEHMIKCGKAGNEAFNNKMKTDSNFSNSVKLRLYQNMKKAHKNGNVNYNTRGGVVLSEEIKLKMSKAKKGRGIGKDNSQYGTKWAWVHKNGEVKKIKLEELENYQLQNWNKGRK